MSIRDLGLPSNPCQKLILVALLMREANHQWCRVSLTDLAEDCSLSRAAIKKHLRVLESSGIVKVDRAGGAVNGYRILL